MSEDTNQNNPKEGKKICPLIKVDCLQDKCEWFVATFETAMEGRVRVSTGKACAVTLLSRLSS